MGRGFKSRLIRMNVYIQCIHARTYMFVYCMHVVNECLFCFIGGAKSEKGGGARGGVI
jgi:hypothetical protein